MMSWIKRYKLDKERKKMVNQIGTLVLFEITKDRKLRRAIEDTKTGKYIYHLATRLHKME